MMADHPSPAAQAPPGRAPQAAGAAPTPTTSAVYWRYLIFWLLFFGLIYFISLFGIVAEA